MSLDATAQAVFYHQTHGAHTSTPIKLWGKHYGTMGAKLKN